MPPQYSYGVVPPPPLRQPSRFTVWIGRQKPLYWWKLGLGGIAAWIIAAMILPDHAGLLSVPAILFLAAATVPLAFVLFCLEHCGQPRVPLPLIGLALAGGAVLALPAGSFLDTVLAPGSSFQDGFGAGIAEETAKAAVVALFALAPGLRLRLPHRLHGLVIGSAVGAGFAIMETMGYGFVTWLQSLLQSNGNANVALLNANHNLADRMALAAFGHVCWTALVGAAIWRNGRRMREHEPLRAVLNVNTLVAWGLAVTLHGLWDGTLNIGFGPMLDLGVVTLPVVVTFIIGPLGLLLLSFFFYDARQRGRRLGAPIVPLTQALPAYLSLVLRGFRPAAPTVYLMPQPMPMPMRGSAAPAGYPPATPPASAQPVQHAPRQP
jgi:RsiW-degrading membrane proteinase PrsW (M82 family)